MEGEKKIISGYLWGDEIGRGTWAKVKRVKRLKDDQTCAVKIFYTQRIRRKIKNGLQLLQNEYEIVRALDHPNIIKYHLLDTESKPEKIYLFMEYCDGDIYALPTKEMLRQLLTGLAYLHAQNIAHHDIKIENILCHQGKTLKIADFGIAERQTEGGGRQSKIFFGTPVYQAPEIQRGPFDGCAADMWAVGILLYKMVMKRYPWREAGGTSHYLLMQEIENSEIDFTPQPSDEHPEIDCKLLDLMRSLLQKCPRARLTASQALEHQYFK